VKLSIPVSPTPPSAAIITSACGAGWRPILAAAPETLRREEKLEFPSFLKRRLPIAVTAITLAGFCLCGAPNVSAGASGWKILPTPSSGSLNQLNAIAAISQFDAWAVGTTGLPDFNSQGVTLHWGGQNWRSVPSPSPAGAVFVNLIGVAASSANDVWAVGRWGSANSLTVNPLVLHWDGSTWQIVETPMLSGGSTLQAVTAIAPNDVWAVGQNGIRTLIEHWDGLNWSVVPSPTPRHGGDLTAVGGSSSTDVWAVGSFFDSTTKTHSMILHWDGVAWSRTPSPETGPSSELEGVTAISPTDAWAVGHSFPSNVATLTEHWDGTSWSVIPGPNLPVSQFHAVVAVASSDVWAVGSVLGPNAQLQTLAEKWNGSSWVIDRTPAVNQVSEFLGVTATPPAIIAVGDAHATAQDPQQTLSEAHAP
jgi:hypothetical protein